MFPFDFAADLLVGDEAWVDYQLAHCPPWLRRTWGERFETMLASAKAEDANLATRATKARMIDEAPDDAVQHIGDDRAIIRAPSEAVATYRARVKTAWDTWATAGTEAGIIALLEAGGATAVALVEDQDVGGALGGWARFYIHIDEPHSFTAPQEWGAFTWGSTFTWGFGDSAAPAYARAVVRQFRPSHTRCLGIVVEWSTVAGFAVLAVEDAVPAYGTPPANEYAVTDPLYNALLSPEGAVLTDGTASA